MNSIYSHAAACESGVVLDTHLIRREIVNVNYPCVKRKRRWRFAWYRAKAGCVEFSFTLPSVFKRRVHKLRENLKIFFLEYDVEQSGRSSKYFEGTYCLILQDGRIMNMFPCSVSCNFPQPRHCALGRRPLIRSLSCPYVNRFAQTQSRFSLYFSHSRPTLLSWRWRQRIPRKPS